MAIIFLQKKKRQKYLILALIAIIILTLFILWHSYLAKPKIPLVSKKISYRPPKIGINFEVLESPILKELQPYEEISSFEEKIGRENPFVPY